MPELPETETIARDLHAEVAGASIASAEVRRADVLRPATFRRGGGPAAFATRLAGVGIVRVWRRAKQVVLDLDTGDRLVAQPRFTGALVLVADEAVRAEPGGGQHAAVGRADDPFACVVLRLGDGRQLAYRDVRRLGTLSLLDGAGWSAAEAALGPEPLGADFTPERLSVILRGSRQAVKAVLMDQRRVAGVGNIYATEACWRAGLDPSREARRVAADAAVVARLHAALVGVLGESIAARGTTFRDFRDAYGGRGGFAERLQAYGRSGSPCARCGRRLVGTHAVDGRMTVFCPGCQG